MAGAFDALPVIVPFFGVMALTVCGGFTALTRRINALTRRVEVVEMAPPPQSPAQSAWAQHQQTQWPVYPSYQTPVQVQTPAPTYPYPSAPPILNTTAYPQQQLR
jgi:hypothetical protein